MALVALVSAKGSPGVTTAALLLTALWPRPVLLLDADVSGGDVALRLPGADGRPLDRDRGLLSVLSLARRELAPDALVNHAQELRGGSQVLAGLAGPHQAGAGHQLWDRLAQACRTCATHDVIVDAGRVDGGSVHLPLLQKADLVAFVLRPDVSGVVHTRERLTSLSPVLSAAGPGPRTGVLLVGRGAHDRDVEGARALLARDLPGVEIFGVLAEDARGAALLSGSEVSRPERTMLVRSGRTVVENLAGRSVGVAAVTEPVADPAPTRRRGAAWVASRRDRRGDRRIAPSDTLSDSAVGTTTVDGPIVARTSEQDA